MEKFNGRPVGLIQYCQYKTKMFLAKRNGRCPITLTFKVILAVLFVFSFLERFKNKVKILIQPYYRKVKIFLAKRNDRHPVIFRITLAVLSAISFAVLFKFVLGFDLIISCKFAALFVPLIYVHELGHAWAMKKCGIVVKGIFFIPFLGAATISKDDTDNSQTPSRATEAQISIMGPAWGAIITLVLAVLYLITGQPIFGTMAFVSSIINLFNLLPFSLLDGGRVFKAIAFSINKWLGMAVMALGLIGVCLLVGNFLNNWIGWIVLMYLMIIGGKSLRYEYQNRHTVLQTRMSVKQMFGYSFAYLGLCAVLLVLMIFSCNESTMQALMDFVQ